MSEKSPRPNKPNYAARRMAAASLAGLSLIGLIDVGQGILHKSEEVVHHATTPEWQPGPELMKPAKPGDTIWQYAHQIQPKGEIRPLVDEMTKDAGPDGLTINERLHVPVRVDSQAEAVVVHRENK